MQNLIFYITILLIYSAVSVSDSSRTFLDNYVGLLRLLRLELIEINSNVQVTQSRLKKFQTRIPKSLSFPCDLNNTRSDVRPKSVHRLRPGDIDVIAAMGDSLTVAMGATAENILQLSLEERGKSFSIGGQGNWKKYTTLPNILKVFNPNLIGFALNTSISVQKESQLNVAEIAAISEDMPYMAKVLISRMKKNPRISINEDWKLITIFIGLNNFCFEICYYKDYKSVLNKHRKDLTETLRILRDNLPKTIINFILIPNLRKLVELKISNPFCEIARRFECPCMFGSQFEHIRNTLYSLMEEWQKIDIEVCNNDEFDRDDFTIVVQPFGINYTFPRKSQQEVDDRYLSADCFHWSQKMHARVANDLWNALMEPVGKKSLDGNDLFKKFHCPNEENPYIFTRRNS